MQLGALRIPCLIGRTGFAVRKREGDGKTPVGRLAVKSVLYRADRVLHPVTKLRSAAIKTSDGWCDAPGHRLYNRQVRLPFAPGHEVLSRRDSAYDILVVLDHNMRPRLPGAGSAVFLHLIRDGATHTEGCIAVSQKNMRIILQRMGPDTQVVISGPQRPCRQK